ncbi:hypothetical protein NQ318_004926 [Aromia moschata]|uniref:Uncharacterized protein n=1 Tax=Aromia moschata TaxID=1265417 RepID=A0AAV8Z2I2_9CUCU|nr:hypothetical protein NQ318_004926 [Aromia moschata]
MNSILYWIVFGILVTLIVVFLSYIALNFILDYCLKGHEELGKMQHVGKEDHDEKSRLNKYHFNRHDVEDLTRIQGDFKTVFPKVTIVNEVDAHSVDQLLKKDQKHEHSSSLSDINEEDGSRFSIDDLHSAAASVYSTITEEREDELKEKKGISKSVDDLEFCDPRGIDVLKEINWIEEETKKVEAELNYFIGSTNDVKFYEINEKFLRLMIALCDIHCETEDLRRKKRETLEYIENCQKKLKEKGANAL